MAGTNPKPVAGIDNKKSRRTKKELELRETAEAEITCKTRNLECPKDLGKLASEMWARIKTIDDSRATPILYDSDSDFIKTLCENWELYERSNKEIKRNGLFIDDFKINPAMKVIDNVWNRLRIGFGELGMTPLGRAKFGIFAAKKGEQETEDDNFF